MKANTAQIIECLNSKQFNIIVIDMNSGTYDTHYFEVRPIQILLYISLTYYYVFKIKKNIKSKRNSFFKIII